MTTKDFEIIDQVANEISPEYKATLSIEEEWVSFENTKNDTKKVVMSVNNLVEMYTADKEKFMRTLKASISGDLTSFDKVKDRIVCRLVNPKRCKPAIDQLVHKSFLDMAMTFRIIVSFEEAEESTLISMPISNMLFSEWGITVDQLYEIAAKNTVRIFGAETLSMIDILLSQMAPEEREIFRQIIDDAPLKQYVLSNRTRTYGAALMFCSDEIKKCAEAWGSDVLILPSSVHEVILLPMITPDQVNINDPDEVNAMVNSINHEYLCDNEEVLSDHSYCYIRSLDKIIVND